MYRVALILNQLPNSGFQIRNMLWEMSVVQLLWSLWKTRNTCFQENADRMWRGLRTAVKIVRRWKILYRQEDPQRMDIIRRLEELMKVPIRIGWQSSLRSELARCSDATNAGSRVASLSWEIWGTHNRRLSEMGALVLLVVNLYNLNLSSVADALLNMLHLTGSVAFVSRWNKARLYH